MAQSPKKIRRLLNGLQILVEGPFACWTLVLNLFFVNFFPKILTKMHFLAYFVTLIFVSQAAVSNYNNNNNYQNNRSNNNRFLQNTYGGRYPQNNNNNNNNLNYNRRPQNNNYYNNNRVNNNYNNNRNNNNYNNNRNNNNYNNNRNNNNYNNNRNNNNYYRPPVRNYPNRKGNNQLNSRQQFLPQQQQKPQYQPPKSISPNQFHYRGYEFTVLNYVNGYRHTHQAQSMTLDEDLNSRAQSCAKYYATRNSIDHSCRQKSGAGENLYMMFTSTRSSDAALRAIQAWYKENSLYHSYNQNPKEFSTGTGHFTQLIWKESEKLGIGVATVGSRTVVVGLFYPPGNYIGRFKNNVLPPHH